MYKLVMMRHGQSQWNQENRFTGWVDVELTEEGKQEAQRAGKTLSQKGFQFDYTYTSLLKRAIRSLWIVLDELDQMWLPTQKAWQLNERHYGALQGLNKDETIQKYGKEQVFTWRRSYASPPPQLSIESPLHPIHDKRYLGIQNLPSTEALSHTQARVLPFWHKEIVPQIKQNQRVLIVAHGNSLRSLIKHLDQVSDEEITQYNIPTGNPLVYELDQDLVPIRNYYLSE